VSIAVKSNLEVRLPLVFDLMLVVIAVLAIALLFFVGQVSGMLHAHPEKPTVRMVDLRIRDGSSEGSRIHTEASTHRDVVSLVCAQLGVADEAPVAASGDAQPLLPLDMTWNCVHLRTEVASSEEALQLIALVKAHKCSAEVKVSAVPGPDVHVRIEAGLRVLPPREGVSERASSLNRAALGMADVQQPASTVVPEEPSSGNPANQGAHASSSSSAPSISPS
jgi:hypothetical protein